VVIPAKKSVRDVGFVLDRHLSAEEHIAATCRIAYAHLKNLARIKRFIDKKSLERLIHALITSLLDYCNSLFYGINESLLQKLQLVQNSCARLLTNTPRSHHITPVLKSLHWLPVRMRIVFKILLLVFKCIHHTDCDCPTYLSQFLTLHSSDRPARTVNTLVLDVPFTRSAFIQQTLFTHFAPILWNNLPFNIRSSDALNVFKSSLKTHLFLQHFNDAL
jgi:hypothetical protein